MTGFRRGEEFLRRPGIALRELQNDGQAVTCIGELGSEDQDSSVRLDRSVEITEGVLHEA